MELVDDSLKSDGLNKMMAAKVMRLVRLTEAKFIE